MKLKRYSKAIVAVAGFLTVAGKVFADAEITAEEALLLLEAAVVAYGVFRVPNAR